MNTTAFRIRLPLGASTKVDALATLRILLLVGVLAWLFYVAARIALTSPPRSMPPAALQMLTLAAAIYLASHGLRVLRLALLIGDSRVSLRDIAGLQLTTAAVTLATPLKLGELYRLYELANLVGGGLRAIIITWWERVFDAVLLLVILFLAFANGAQSTEFGGLAVLIGVFVVGTATTFFVLPDNLRRLSVLIIRRYSSPRTVGPLKAIELFRRAILEAPRLVSGKIASLLVLTALIWAAQVASIMIAYPMLSGSLTAASESLLGFLSSVLRSESPLSGLHRAAGERTAALQALEQAPLVFVGLVAGVHYLARRLRADSQPGGWLARRSNG